jgi:hypothetical protein
MTGILLFKMVKTYVKILLYMELRRIPGDILKLKLCNKFTKENNYMQIFKLQGVIKVSHRLI